MTASTYTLKSVKTFVGRDGGGLEAKLCRDGQVIAEVFNGGHGGPNDYHWLDAKGPRVEHTIVQTNGHTYTHAATVEEKRLFDAVATLPPLYAFGDQLEQNMDIFVGHLAERHDNIKRFTRKLKANLIYQVEGGEVVTLKAAYSPDLARRVRERDAGKTVTIFNELPKGAEAVFECLYAQDQRQEKAAYEAKHGPVVLPEAVVQTVVPRKTPRAPSRR